MGAKRFLPYVVALVAMVTAVQFSPPAFGQESTVVFDNQSGDPALVKLVGPTQRVVEVPTGEKRTVSASAGQYYILVRYGTLDTYRYARGDGFTITETATKRSEISITLHKVIGGNYGTRAVSEKEFGDETGPRAQKARDPQSPAARDVAALSFVVPDRWKERYGKTWSKCVQTASNVSPLGEALGLSEGQPIGHAYWENEKKEFQGVYFELKGAHPAIQFVPWQKIFIPGLGEPRFPPHLECQYYTFRGRVYSARPTVIKGKNWPVMSEVFDVDHKFIRGEEKVIGGRRCLRADPIVSEVLALGEALGYAKGERVGPPYWAEWQPKDDYAANPVAPYEKE